MSNQDLVQRVRELDAAAAPPPWTMKAAPGDFKASESMIIGPRGRSLLFVSDNGRYGQVENSVGAFITESRVLLPLLAKRLAIASEANHQLAEIDELLRQAGIDPPLGRRGVADVITQRNAALDRADRAEAALAAQNSERLNE